MELNWFKTWGENPFLYLCQLNHILWQNLLTREEYHCQCLTFYTLWLHVFWSHKYVSFDVNTWTVERDAKLWMQCCCRRWMNSRIFFLSYIYYSKRCLVIIWSRILYLISPTPYGFIWSLKGPKIHLELDIFSGF